MKLGLDLSCLSEPWAGMQHYTVQFLTELVQQSPHPVTGWGFPDMPPLPESVRRDLRFHTLPAWVHSRLLREQVMIPLAARNSVDRILVPAYLGGVIYQQPVDLIVYDLLFLRSDSGLSAAQKTYWRGLYRIAFSRARKLLPISQTTARQVREEYSGFESRLGPVLYPGLRSLADEEKPDTSPSSERASVDPYILFVGTISPRKNVRALIEWFTHTDPSIREDFDLRLAGDYGWGNLDPDDLNRPDRGIYWHGRVRDGELRQLYRDARLLILPSRGEGFGMPILEAFKHRLPVVLSDIPIFREVAADAAFYLPGLAPRTWTPVLRAALYDTNRRQDRIETGRKRLNRYRWEDSVQKYLGMYH